MELSEFGGSLNDYIMEVRTAFLDRYPDYWPSDVFETHLIAQGFGETQKWLVEYTLPDDDDEDGTITFASKSDWAKVKLEYVRETTSNLLRTDVPNVDARPDVDMDALVKGDDDPLFITLEIMREGTVSANGLHHTEKLIRIIELQINTEGTEGIMGHLRESERSYAYPVSDIHWVGATSQEGVLWAKGYIPQSAHREREHFRILQATGSKAATSIYGFAMHRFVDKDAGIWEADDFVLEQLDLAPYKRAAAPPGETFSITQETIGMANEGNNKDELRVVQEQLSASNQRVQELEQRIETDAIAQLASTRVSECINWSVRDEKGQRVVEAMQKLLLRISVTDGTTRENVVEHVDNAWKDMKVIAETVRDALHGPSAVNNGSETVSPRDQEFTDKDVAEARRKTGI